LRLLSQSPPWGRLIAFIRFAGLSGCGWLFDLCLLTTLVEITQIGPAWANMISSMSAAAIVFLIARDRIFTSAGGAAPVRLIAYVAYTALQVAIASAAIGALVHPIAAEAQGLGLAGVSTLAAVLAKIIVTPAQLALNFLVAGGLNRPAPRRAVRAHA
jgi:putative flippase GtrA